MPLQRRRSDQHGLVSLFVDVPSIQEDEKAARDLEPCQYAAVWWVISTSTRVDRWRACDRQGRHFFPERAVRVKGFPTVLGTRGGAHTYPGVRPGIQGL